MILEVNRWQPDALDGMHDIYTDGALPPHRTPIPLAHPGDRIGSPYLEVPRTRWWPWWRPTPPTATVRSGAGRRLPGHRHAPAGLLRFEVRQGRIPANLLPIQSGVGNIANAFMQGLAESEFRGLTAFTEVIQDGIWNCSSAARWSWPRPPPSP